MAYFADIVQPVTGSGGASAGAVLRMVRQMDSVVSSSFWNPSGFTGTGSLFLAANPDRAFIHLRNSGSAAVGISLGSAARYPFYSLVIAAGGAFRWSQGQVFTGPIYAYWLTSGTLSSSVLISYDFSYGAT